MRSIVTELVRMLPSPMDYAYDDIKAYFPFSRKKIGFFHSLSSFLPQFEDEHDTEDYRESEHDKGEKEADKDHHTLGGEKTYPEQGYKTDQVVKDPSTGVLQIHVKPFLSVAIKTL